MRIHLSNWNGTYCIVSVAKSRDDAEELKRDGISHWRIDGARVQTWPEEQTFSFSQDEVNELKTLNSYDVIEVREDGTVVRLYDDATLENVLFITGRCNSGCIMCPSPTFSRKNGTHTPLTTLLALADHIPADTRHLTITGGEPFMIGEQMFVLLQHLKERFQNTDFLLLTNGRAFALEHYREKLKETLPAHTTLGIPIHASCAELHDSITQSQGSFAQTVCGVEHLLRMGLSIELRIVVSRMNLADLPDLAKMIAARFSRVSHVSIMGMEMTGNAHENRDAVWVSYKESADAVSAATDILARAGIDVMLYNYPLCTVDRRYWPICKKSISPDKVRFSQSCEICSVRTLCGGVFGGTIRLEKNELVPIT